VVVAVALADVVQVAIDKVIDVVTVRHGGVAAVGAVDVRGVVSRAGMLGRAVVRVLVGDFEGVLVVVALVRVVEVAVMEVIDVAVVLNGEVAAVGAVDVGMRFVDGMHGGLSLRSDNDQPIA
jgi:hypothetical protein